MKQFIAILLIALIASAQEQDWKTCADEIIKLETDLVDFASWVQVQVEEIFIEDVHKIIAECKAKNDWATCAEKIFEMGEHVMEFGDKTIKTVKEVIIPDIVKIEDTCKKSEIDEEISDWPTCLEDISKIVEIAGKITEDIKKFNFVNLVKDIQELYNIVQKALKDCTKTSLEFFPMEDDWPTCLEDISKIVELAGKITSDIKKFDFVSLVKDIQELYNIVQKAIKDCTKTTYEDENDWPTCLEDISKIVELASKITADIKKFNFVALVKDVQELYNIVQKALKDCTKTQLTLPELREDDWPTCLEDVSKIVELASKITADIKKFDFVSLVKDIQELYNIVQKAIKDCTKTQLTLPELREDDWPTCLEDISKIVEIAGRIQADIKKFDFVALVKDIQELYNVVQKAIKDCTKSQLEQSPDENDWPACLEDISKIVELASKVTSDIKKFDFVSLVKDIQELYNVVQKAIKDCTK